jgi:phage terminase small subunit
MVTPKHNNRAKRFVLEYAKDFNGTRAAIAAGYSPKTAAVKASQLLTKVKVREELERILAKLSEKLELSAERVLRELARLAFLDPRKLFREDGSLKPITELDDDTAAALASMEIERRYEHYAKGQARNTRTVTKIKFADTVRALELLGRHLKLFTDKVEVSRFEGLAERLAAIRKRKNAAG